MGYRIQTCSLSMGQLRQKTFVANFLSSQKKSLELWPFTAKLDLVEQEPLLACML